MIEDEKPADDTQVADVEEHDESSTSESAGEKKKLIFGVGIAALVALVAVLAFVLTSGSSNLSDQDKIKDAYKTSGKAFVEGNGKVFCEHLTPETQALFASQAALTTGTGDCALGLTNLLKGVKALANQDWKAYCEALGPRFAQSLAKEGPALKTAKSCEAVAQLVNETQSGRQTLASLRQQTDAFFKTLSNGQIATIKINGNSALVAIKGAAATDRPLHFTKSADGKWLIDEAQ